MSFKKFVGGVAEGLLSPLELVNTLPEFLRSFQSQSLVDYTATTRIEPIMIFGMDIWKNEYSSDIAQSCLNLVAALYLQAVGLSTVLAGVDVRRRLEKFNPNRELLNPIADAIARGAQLALPATESSIQLMPTISQVALEAEGARLDKQREIRELMENNNLMVGKMMDITVREDDKEINIPVSIRLNTIPATSDNLTNIISAGSEDIRFKVRLDKLIAGKISFWADFVACTDILDQHRKAILTDTTGLYLKTLERAKKNKLAGLLSGNPSVASASNIYVISEATALNVERKLNIKLRNFNHRQRIFEKSPLMLLVVLDRESDQVTFYLRNQAFESNVNVDALSRSVSNNSQDIMKIINQLQAGGKSAISLF